MRGRDRRSAAGGEVHERPGDRGDRDPVPDRRVAGVDVRERRVLTPRHRRSVGAVTSGGGAGPLRGRGGNQPPVRSAPPRRHTPEPPPDIAPPRSAPDAPRDRRRDARGSMRPYSGAALISARVTPTRSSCARVTTPCAAPANRASCCSTVLSLCRTTTLSQEASEIHPLPATFSAQAVQRVRHAEHVALPVEVHRQQVGQLPSNAPALPRPAQQRPVGVDLRGVRRESAAGRW